MVKELSNCTVVSRAPLRITFVGGGTDISEYYTKNGYGSVINAAIDKYIYVFVNKRFEDSIRVKYSVTENVDRVDDIKHPSVREALRFFDIKKGIEIDSMSDIPSTGTGLGSSSTFLVSLLNGLHTWLGEEYTDPKILAEEAVKIERNILREAGGKQDQYVAAYGGLNYWKFNSDGSVERKPIKMDSDSVKGLEKNLLLLYTGVSRSSSNILKKQTDRITDKTPFYTEMRGLADSMYAAMSSGDWKSTGSFLDRNWHIKKDLEGAISNGDLDSIYSTGIANGATGGKVIGAGGGGFMLFFADAVKHSAIRNALPSLRYEPFRLSFERCKTIYSDRH